MRLSQLVDDEVAELSSGSRACVIIYAVPIPRQHGIGRVDAKILLSVHR
jgi:hypothetical protein